MSDVINNEDDMIYINNGQKLFSKRTIDPESKKVLKGNSEKNNDNNMKKIRKLKSKENPDDNINTIEPISTTFIEEPKKIRIKRGSKLLNIDFVYRRNNLNVKINKNETFNDLKEKISEIINIQKDTFEIFLKDELIQNEQYEEKVYDIIKKVRFPLFFIKKKSKELDIISQFYSKSYVNKLIIEGFESTRDLVNHIDIFFKNSLAQRDYLYEALDNNKYIVGFKTPDLAFDFHRYIIILKLTHSQYKNIKCILKIDNPPKPSKYRNIKEIQFKRLRFKSSNFSPKLISKNKKKITEDNDINENKENEDENN